jgi:hypothetical protein
MPSFSAISRLLTPCWKRLLTSVACPVTVRGPLAIVQWNTVYIERAVKTLSERGQMISDALLAHLSPLGWEHINLRGDYVWKPDSGTKQRPLRQLRLPISADDPNP